jgi:hypothetical protein
MQHFLKIQRRQPDAKTTPIHSNTALALFSFAFTGIFPGRYGGG